MTNDWMRWTAAAMTLSVAACGTEPMLALDEAVVSERAEAIAALVPQCETTGSGEMARTSAQQVAKMLRLIDLMALLSPDGDIERTPIAGFGATGSCGGTVEVTSEHGNGNTAYTVDLMSFCVSSADGDITYNGRLQATQIGSSSPEGPIVSALDAHTLGPIEVVNGDTTLSAELSGLRVEYGNPMPWNPAYPDEAHPDQIALGEMVVDWNDGERVDFIRDVKAERPTGVPATLHILSGQVGAVGDGMVTIRTPADDPLVANPGSLPAISGSIEAQGADGTSMVVTPANMTLTFEVNGTPMAEQLDCSNLVSPTIELVAALMGALPVR